MLTETRPIVDLVERLKKERRVWVRLAANRPQDDWQLSLLEVIVGEAGPTWTRGRWDYGRAVFIASVPTGGTVARWLERSRISLDPLSLSFELGDLVQVDRRQSRFAGIFEALPWPSVEWKLHVRSDTRQMLQGELVAADAPAFLSFDHAAAAFFGLPPSPNRGFSGSELIVREQDRRARIDSVRVRPSEVIAAVVGEQLNGTMLTLGGLAAQRKHLRRGSREVHFRFAGPIPAGTWLALHRDQELLDRRGLDPAWGSEGVEIEVDPVTEVEVLISRGEGVSTEFKRQLPDANDRESVVSVMKTVAAFASGDGGTILFGVANDGTIVGLGGNGPRKTVDWLTSLISDWVRPLADFRPELAEVGGKQVLFVRVDAGTEPPYGVGTTDRGIDYYVRRGATSFPATPADLRSFVRARLPTTSPPSGFPYR
jgi:hypothetical protein